MAGAQAPGEGGAGPSAYGRWGPLAVPPESLEAAVGLTAHAVAGTLAVLVLASTTPMVDLLAALRRLRVPDACVEVASLTYRLLFVLMDAVRSIREAQAGRLGYHGPRAGRRVAVLLGPERCRPRDLHGRLPLHRPPRAGEGGVRTGRLRPQLPARALQHLLEGGDASTFRYILIGALVLALLVASSMAVSTLGGGS